MTEELKSSSYTRDLSDQYDSRSMSEPEVVTL